MSNDPDILTWVRERLVAARDESYAAFMRPLMPTVEPDRIIGVRTPELRRIAKEAARRADVRDYLVVLPHPSFEETQIHAFVISATRDYDEAVAQLEAFLPFVDNWATCDQLSPKVLARRPQDTLALARGWMASGQPYIVRFGIETLMRHFLDDGFEPCLLEEVARVESPDYYVNMMRAWFFAEALVHERDAALAVIQEARLDRWTHNKAIQKAIESRRVSDEDKALLRTLRRGRPEQS